MKSILTYIIAFVAAFGLNPLTARVTDLDREADTVTIETATGHLYQYHGCEDYEIGDYVSAILWNAGTPNDCRDDIIISVHYSGYSDYAGDTLN